MKRQLTLIHCRDETRLRKLFEQLVQRLERFLPPDTPPDSFYLHGRLERNSVHERYRAAILLNVPGRTLVAKEEGQEAERTLREAMAELERQLGRHKAFVRHEPEWSRPARREAIEEVKQQAARASSGPRQVLGDLILAHLDRLDTVLRREMAVAQATGDLLPGELTVDEAVDAVVERALSRADHLPADLEVDCWLLKLSLDYLDEEIARRKRLRAAIVPPEGDVPDTPDRRPVIPPRDDDVSAFFQPHEDLRLEDLVPGVSLPAAEQVAERRDVQRYVTRTMAGLPRMWRRAFVLHDVQGLSIREVAAVLGEPADRVIRSLEHAREFLRQKVAECGKEVPA